MSDEEKSEKNEGLILGKFKNQADLEKSYLESQKKISQLSAKPDWDNMSKSELSNKLFGSDEGYQSDLAGDYSSLSAKVAKEQGVPRHVADKIVKSVISSQDKKAILTQKQQTEKFLESPDTKRALLAYLTKSGKDPAQFEIDLRDSKISVEDLEIYVRHGKEYLGSEGASGIADSNVELDEESATEIIAKYKNPAALRSIVDPNHPDYKVNRRIYEKACKKLDIPPVV